MNTHDFEPVIGLEIHAELCTKSKMFCACPVLNTRTAEPNVAICPVCVGLPGALPVLNRRAVDHGLLVGLALGCRLREFVAFARKNYFYPDLPKGYQISQYEYPLGYEGSLEIPGPASGTHRVRVRRVHLEEDTAKLLHLPGGTSCLVDFNRSGVPLLEIVSEPDLHSAETVLAYATQIRAILRYLGVNSGDMEKGVLRFEANVSVRRRGEIRLGTRTEIKNLNSFRTLGRAVAQEIERQAGVLGAGGVVVQQTLGWDEERDALVMQRGKEEAHDYRYFPEPDLPAIPVGPEWVARVQEQLPELPDSRCARFQTQYGLPATDAQVLTADRSLADYTESVLHIYKGPPKTVSNWLTGEFLRLLHEAGDDLSRVRARPGQFAELLGLVDSGALNQGSAKMVLGEMFATGVSPQEVIKTRGLTQITDEGELACIAAQLVRENPGPVAQYLAGKETVLQWLVGQVMRATRGQADPQRSRQALLAVLDSQRR